MDLPLTKVTSKYLIPFSWYLVVIQSVLEETSCTPAECHPRLFKVAPRICNILGTVRVIQNKLVVSLRIVAENPVHIPQVVVINSDNQIISGIRGIGHAASAARLIPLLLGASASPPSMLWSESPPPASDRSPQMAQNRPAGSKSSCLC